MPPIQFLAERRERGQTVAEMLHKRFHLSWAAAKRIVENGFVRVAGQTTRLPELRLKTGNRIWIAAGAIEIKNPDKVKKLATADKKQGTDVPRSPKKQVADPPKPKKPATPDKKPKAEAPSTPAHIIDIVYSDDEIVVVNKPIGLTTMRHAEEAEEFGRGKKYLPKTLADLLPALLGSPNKPVIAVHRIDRDTTGLLIFARTQDAAKSLMKQFKVHTVERRYMALTRGVPKSSRIESVFVDDRGDGRRGSVEKGEGKRAVTNVTVIEDLGEFALVECRLETGRTHQVRIHLGESGFPICGEKVYDRALNGKKILDASGATRPMLHAARLGIIHPETGDRMTWDAKLPKDFETLLTGFRAKKGS